ncbi:MAG: sulfotransferase domain-containing protein [Planctomycetota bacterium]
MSTDPQHRGASTLADPPPSNHPTIVMLSVHKGASTFLTDRFGPALEQVFGMRHVPVHQEQLRGVDLAELALPPTGVVATRVYPPQYDTLVEDPVPAGGRFADKKLIMLRRDPRDVAVSFYYSFAFSHTPPPGEGKNTKRFHARREALQKMDLPTGILKYTAKPAIKQFLATVEFLERYPDTCLTTYETLTTDFPAWMATVQRFLGWTDEQAAQVSAGLEDEVRPPDEEDPYQHKRRVTPGNWREAFTPKLCRLFQRKLGSLLTDAGYEW